MAAWGYSKSCNAAGEVCFVSSFYYCHDCKREVDLKNKSIQRIYFGNEDNIKICSECGSTNWVTMVDSPGGEPKEKI